MSTRPSIVAPALGMLALLPGLLTYSFAKGEATQLNSDWVKISVPLLLLGFASLSWLLSIKLGRIGVGAGAAAGLLAIGGMLVSLKGTIDERAKWMDSSKALSDAGELCTPRGKPDPRARAYQAGTKNPAVFFKADGYSGPSKMYESELDRYEPERYQIEEAALVACVLEKRESVEKCGGYSEGGIAERERIDTEVKLVSIKTGEVVFEKLFSGTPPRACGSVETFYGKSKHVTISGEAVPREQVMAALTAKLQ